MPSAPHALARAMSTRRMPDRSWRCTATSCPPASSTTTVSGTHLISAALANAPPITLSAICSVSLAIRASLSGSNLEGLMRVGLEGEALRQRHDGRLDRSAGDVDAVADRRHDA